MIAADPAFEAWIDAARQASVQAELVRRGLWTKAMAGDNGVPCPGCGGRDRFAVNTRKNLWNCRASGEGGDAIALAQHIDGSSFLTAVETVTGQAPPGRASALRPEQRDEVRNRAEVSRSPAADADELAPASSDVYRERERRRAWECWQAGRPVAGTQTEDYLALRGVQAPAGARLRHHPRLAFWDRPGRGGRVIHEGPAMIAAIEGPTGKFAGVQRTWIDLARPKGKALIVQPETGEILPAKKVRGSVKGGTILLKSPPEESAFPGDWTGARRLFLGEGIETVLSVLSALWAGRSALIEGAEFRTSIDLGNLAGKAAGRIKHPSQTRADKNGHLRPVFVPDSEPKDDPDFPLIPIASGVRELWLLGDGDSEPVFTRLALERAGKRFSRAYPQLLVRLMIAPHGADFNDVLNGMAAA
jgi:hypothetical protein